MSGIPNRYTRYLRKRYRSLLGYTGLIDAVIGVLILVPLMLLPFYPQERALAPAFLVAGLIPFVAGVLLWVGLVPKEGATLSYQEGAVILVLSWGVAVLFGAIPFLWILDLTFTQAFFESTSGWTTTGLSVVDVEQAPRMILLYRSVLQWAGGAGLAIIALSALTGPIGPGISIAEGRGDQLVPHVRRSAEIVLSLYVGYNVIGILLLYLAGMSWFDAVNHAFAALSTGGFSTRAESIGFWDSAAIEAVLVPLMLMGNLNYLTAYTLIKGKWRAVLRNGELHLMGLLIPLATGALVFVVTWALYPTLGKGVRVALFETVSALSTTGFTTVSYESWPGFGWIVLVVLMLIGGGSGSTAGAIKQYRIYVLYRSLVWEIRRMFLPSGTVTEPFTWVGDARQFLGDKNVRQVGLFVFVYLITLFLGSAIIAAHGYGMAESLFEFASTLGTVGLSVGITGAELPPLILWTQSLGMLLGRLEFFTVIVGVGKIVADLPPLFDRTQEEAEK